MEPVVVRGLGLEERRGAGETGVVDDDVEPAEPQRRRGQRSGDRLLLADIDGDGEDAIRVGERLRLAAGRVLVQIGEDDGGTEAVQPLRDREPDARGRAGDERDPTRQRR